jgi:hypothetical protein
MSSDLNSIMGDWPYDPASISARWIVGAGWVAPSATAPGPGYSADGTRWPARWTAPARAESLLDHYEKLEREAGAEPGAFRLDAAMCGELQQEAAQYYYRYIALYALHDLAGVMATPGTTWAFWNWWRGGRMTTTWCGSSCNFFPTSA